MIICRDDVTFAETPPNHSLIRNSMTSCKMIKTLQNLVEGLSPLRKVYILFMPCFKTNTLMFVFWQDHILLLWFTISLRGPLQVDRLKFSPG